MKLSLLVRKLELCKEKYIVAGMLKDYCARLGLEYLSSVKYLLRNDYLVRILKGIFYVKSIEERKLKKITITPHTALKTALEIKGTRNWYLGIESALKLNNLTHEYFTKDFVITDSIFRPRPVNIMGRSFEFIKLKKNMFTFGIIKNGINYSDPEKTILDIVYIGKYRGMPPAALKNKISPYLPHCSKKKIETYLFMYPSTVRKLVEELL